MLTEGRGPAARDHSRKNISKLSSTTKTKRIYIAFEAKYTFNLVQIIYWLFTLDDLTGVHKIEWHLILFPPAFDFLPRNASLYKIFDFFTLKAIKQNILGFNSVK